jgi:hypothetical protein
MRKTLTALAIGVGLIGSLGVRCGNQPPGTLYTLARAGFNQVTGGAPPWSWSVPNTNLSNPRIVIEWTRDPEGNIIDGPAVIHQYDLRLESPGFMSLTISLDGLPLTVDVVGGRFELFGAYHLSGIFNCSGRCVPDGFPTGVSSFGPVQVQPRRPDEPEDSFSYTRVFGPWIEHGFNGAVAVDLGLGVEIPLDVYAGFTGVETASSE